MSENLDNVKRRYYRKWLHFPVSGIITHLSSLKNKLGLKQQRKLLKTTKETTKETIWNEFIDLKEHCGIIKFLINSIPTNQLVQ